jgi:hypothetical protein
MIKGQFSMILYRVVPVLLASSLFDVAAASSSETVSAPTWWLHGHNVSGDPAFRLPRELEAVSRIRRSEYIDEYCRKDADETPPSFEVSKSLTSLVCGVT